MPVDGQEDEVPELTALFDEVDRPKLEAEAFELFKTMEVGCYLVWLAVISTLHMFK